MRTVGQLAFALLFLGFPATAVAEKSKRTIAGWVGDDIVVHVEISGVIDDPDSADANRSYFYETHDRYDTNGKIVSRHRTGATDGPVPNPASVSKTAIKNLSASRTGWTSPDRTAHLVRVVSESIEKKSSKAICTTHEELALVDQTADRVFSILKLKTNGSPARASKVKCPRPSVTASWSHDGSRFGFVHQLGGKVQVLSRTRALLNDGYVIQPMLNPLFAPKGRLESASQWRSMVLGESVPPDANEATEDRFAMLVLDTELNAKQKRSAADKLFAESDKSTWAWGLKAAVYRSTGETRSTKKFLDKGITNATSYQDLAELGYLFYEFDLDLAAQLLVHALSHPSAKVTETPIAYSVLIRTLVDSGNLTAAKELVERFRKTDEGDPQKTLPLNIQRELVRYETQRHTKNAKQDAVTLLSSDLGVCDGYFFLGRAVAQKDTRQALNLFRAAVMCDPRQPDALFLLADIELRTGAPTAIKRFKKYLKIAPPRFEDSIRDVRREHAAKVIAEAKRKEKTTVTP